MEQNEQNEQVDMMQEQIRHINRLIMRQDGAENILKLVKAQKKVIEMIMARDFMEKARGEG